MIRHNDHLVPTSEDRVKEERLLEMLHFYSDTFTRLLFSEFGDVAETAVTMISSILNYDLAVLYTPITAS